MKRPEEISFNQLTTCCVTGHRNLKNDIDQKTLKNEFIKLIEKGYDTFLVGFAVGFDTLCFKTLEKLKKDYPIKTVACVPCPNQDARFSFLQKIEYRKMLEQADERVLICEYYTNYCMNKRNKYMVDNSSAIVVYLRENKGGTFNTYRMAQSKGIEIIMV